jgi:tetratricopeptide (TPR) repeat protein
VEGVSDELSLTTKSGGNAMSLQRRWNGLAALLVAWIALLITPAWGSAQSSDRERLLAATKKWQDLEEAGKLEEASEKGEEALALAVKIFGADHKAIGAFSNDLANLYSTMGQYAKAEPLFQRGLRIREARLGPEHPDVAQSLNDLAALYLAMGQYAKAEPLFQRGLRIREARLGPEHPDVAASLNNLAVLYWDMGQYAMAEP